MERTEVCVAACEGIPDSYLVNGQVGLKAWFANKGIEHDTPIMLSDLGRYTPVRRCRAYVYGLASRGNARQDGLIVKLETFQYNGVLSTTLENYFRMQLVLDGKQIVCIEKQADDVRLCMAMCSLCQRWLKFPVLKNLVREIVLRGQHHWGQEPDNSWTCDICLEKLCKKP